MILRNAVLSDDRRTVGRASRGHAATGAATADSMREAAHTSSAVELLSSHATGDGTMALPMPAREQRLTFEAVAAWLAVQDAETRAACASILADELTLVHESAKADGFAAGQSQGREEAQQAADSRLALLDSLVQAAETAFEQEQLRLAELCADIVAEAFAKIAGTLLAGREASVAVVMEVLKRVKEAREVTVRVTPAELSTMLHEEPRLAAALPGRNLLIVADPRVGIGGCIVDSKLGSLDGRLEAQLRGLYETLRAAKAARTERA